jgi:leader peptidase (prepilin peptidase) / N-methyltransferase
MVLLLMPLVIFGRSGGDPTLMLTAVTDALLVAGATALAAGLFWWLLEIGQRASGKEAEGSEGGEGDPIAIGFGDIKLAAALGALLPSIPLLTVAFLIACLSGAIGGILLRQRTLPFGPHLVLGALASLTVGPHILHWYLTISGLTP